MAALNKLSAQDRSLTVSDDTAVKSTDVVRVLRDLGVIFDPELTMKQHIASLGRLLLLSASYASNTSPRRTGGRHTSHAGHDYVTS